MSSVANPAPLSPTMDDTPAASRSWERTWPPVGLALSGGLLPLRANWGVSLVLVALAFSVPGVLALRAARIPSRVVCGYPIYVPAASALVLMLSGLAWDLVGPLFGVHHPLHGVSVALAVIVASVALWLGGLGARDAAVLPWRRTLARPTLLLPLALPALSAVGALLLTNHHGGSVATVGAFVDLAVAFVLLLVAPRLPRAHIVMVLFGCTLAGMWAISLRSQEIVGYDISTEIFIAKHTQRAGIWHAVNHDNAYAAMLSITVLPSTLAAMTGISPEIAFKVLYPALCALVPASVFLVGDRLLSRRFAVGAAVLLLIQNYFFQLLPQLARQEIGLLFFAALLAALLELNLHRRHQIGLIAAMGIGLVISHYSSTYLAIPLLAVAIIVRLVVARWRRLSVVSVPLLCAAVVVIGGAALWDGAITQSQSNVSSFVSTLDSHGLDLLPNRSGGISAYLNGNNVDLVSASKLERAAVADDRRTAKYVRPLPQSHQTRYDLRDASVPGSRLRAPKVSNAINSVFLPIFNELLLLLFAVGSIVMLLRRRWPPLAFEVGVLGTGALAFLLFIRFSGTGAAEYNQTRALAQSLILLSLPAAWMLERLTARLPARVSTAAWVALSAAAALMFAQQSGLVSEVLGGPRSLNLAQSGEDFERLYATPAELGGADWSRRAAHNSILYADRYAELRLLQVSGRGALTYVMPRTLDRYGWVYGSRTNVQLGRARTEVGNDLGTYRWPGVFLNRYYNLVYDNGDSQVFHGS